MPDPRVQKLAKVLVQYSLKIKPGERLLITGSPITAPLIREVYREAIRAGGHVDVRTSVEGLSEIYFHEASDAQLTYISELAKIHDEHFDTFLTLLGSENTKSLSGVDPKKQAIRRQATAPIFQRFLERMGSGDLRWCGTQFPTQADAQDAGMSLSDYEDFVYGAGLLDLENPAAEWEKVRAEQQKIADFLAKHDEIHIVAKDTDLTYRVGGRHWVNCAGTVNFPDGEVFSGPIEDSVQGVIRFTYPAIREGREVEDVRLTFRDGKAVEATAARGQDFLNASLDTDEGSRFVGEVAFGTNYNIQLFSGNTLFDEKIGGTMHMALGASIPESGGVNKSGLHWDMVCDLRGEGKVFADGKLCYENGKFLI